MGRSVLILEATSPRKVPEDTWISLTSRCIQMPIAQYDATEPLLEG